MPAPAGAQAAAAPPAAASSPLTLAEAVETARAHQPELARARASTTAAAARVDAAFAPLLPQLSTAAGYSLQTTNVAGQPGGASFDLSNRFSFSANASQLVWDFGSTWYRYKAAGAGLESQREAQATQLAVSLLQVRAAFFRARATRALVQVAQENLASQLRHLAQIEGFVKAGTRRRSIWRRCGPTWPTPGCSSSTRRTTTPRRRRSSTWRWAWSAPPTTRWPTSSCAARGRGGPRGGDGGAGGEGAPGDALARAPAGRPGAADPLGEGRLLAQRGRRHGVSNVGVDSVTDTALNWSLGPP
jgi:hypothetical protein